MNGLQTNEAEKIRREALMHVGNRLSDHYGDVMKENIPNRLTDLLRRLAAPKRDDSKKADRKDSVA